MKATNHCVPGSWDPTCLVSLGVWRQQGAGTPGVLHRGTAVTTGRELGKPRSDQDFCGGLSLHPPPAGPPHRQAPAWPAGMAAGEALARGSLKAWPRRAQAVSLLWQQLHMCVSVMLPLNNRSSLRSHEPSMSVGMGPPSPNRSGLRPQGSEHLRLTSVFDGSVEVAGAL